MPGNVLELLKRGPLSIVLLGLTMACTDRTTGPDPSNIATLRITEIAAEDQTLEVGEQLQLEATAFSRGGLVVEAPLAWQSRAPLVASVSGAGLVRGLAPGDAWIVASVPGGVRDSVQIAVIPPPLAECVPSQATVLEVGEVVQVAGEAAVSACLGEGTYVAVPFYSSETSEARLVLTVTAAGIAAEPPLATSIHPPRTSSLPFTKDLEWEERLREREIRELTHLIARDRGAAFARQAPSIAFDQLAAGDLLDFNTSADCDSPSLRTARIVAVSDRAIIAADTLNPAGGLSNDDYVHVAETVDTLIYPVDVEYFGEPTDVDGNERMIILYTGAVNELTEPDSESFVGGFFWAGDLFPTDDCAGSNFAEMFYMLAADPDGDLGNAFSRDFVVRTTLNTVAHEFQHLINAARRIYVNDATTFETTWLNEALSHMAEELVFYRSAGLGPRQNLGEDEIRDSQKTVDAANTYLISNVSRFVSYLEDPDTVSLIGVDDLPTRGAGWAFLRYSADRHEASDQDFLASLVNSKTAGTTNFENATGEPALAWMQDWTVSVYADDLVPGTAAAYLQPSWNFRSLVPAIFDGYPLAVRVLEEGVNTFTIRAGGASFIRFAVGSAGAGSLRWAAADNLPPPEFRLSIQRTN